MSLFPRVHQALQVPLVPVLQSCRALKVSGRIGWCYLRQFSRFSILCSFIFQRKNSIIRPSSYGFRYLTCSLHFLGDRHVRMFFSHFIHTGWWSFDWHRCATFRQVITFFYENGGSTLNIYNCTNSSVFRIMINP